MQKLIFLTLILFCLTTSLFSQETLIGTIKGRVLSDDGESLIGANIKIINMDNSKTYGAFANVNGEFIIEKVEAGNYMIYITYISYDNFSEMVIIETNKTTSKDFILQGSAIRSKTVEVFADRAKFRETPIAFSEISKQEIDLKLGGDDIPLILNSAPGVHSTKDGNGFGASRVSIRGFKERNLSVVINGVPVNDMENGNIYWSNWLGIGDVTTSKQVQRGLGATKLSNPSVGGTMNIITDAASRKAGVTVKNQYRFYDNSLSNHSLNNPFTGEEIYSRDFSDRVFNSRIIANTGLIDKLAITMAVDRSFGEGIVDATWLDARSYYLGASYDLNEKHFLDFYIYGSPQRGGRKSFRVPVQVYDTNYARKLGVTDGGILDGIREYGGVHYGRLYNPNWGYWNTGDDSKLRERLGKNQSYLMNNQQRDFYNSDYFNQTMNFFHKPHATLNWHYQINKKSSLSNVFYLSTGNGGGTSLTGFPIYSQPNVGILQLQQSLETNFINLDNRYSLSRSRSEQVLAANRNNHFWTGVLSNYEYKIDKNTVIQTGLDYRYYEGEHYQEIIHMLAGDYFVETTRRLHTGRNSQGWGSFVDSTGNDNLAKEKTELHNQLREKYFDELKNEIENNTSMSPSEKQIALTRAATEANNRASYESNQLYKRKLGDKINYNYLSKINWYGGYFQLEKRINKFLGYINLASVVQSYERIDYFRLDADRTTERQWFLGYTLKGGGNYNFNNNINSYFNTGYYVRPPFFNAVFTNFNTLIDDVRSEKVLGIELGTNFINDSRTLQATINLYRTQWNDQTRTYFPQRGGEDTENYQGVLNLIGQDALHQGIEIDLMYKPFKKLWFNMALSLGSWKWTNNPLISEQDPFFKQSELDELSYPLDKVYSAGLYVGDAPQKMLFVSGNYIPIKNLRLTLDWKYNWDYYADFNPEALTQYVWDNQNKKVRDEINIPQPWKLPSYWLLDLYAQYRFFNVLDKFNVVINFRVNNLTDNLYISDARFRRQLPNFDVYGVGDTNGLFDNPDMAEVHLGWVRSYSFGINLEF